MKQAEKVSQVGSDSPLYSDTKKVKVVKITKWKHAFKGYASSYVVEILNSFNPKLQFKDTESAIKNKHYGFRGFKFVTALVFA